MNDLVPARTSSPNVHEASKRAVASWPPPHRGERVGIRPLLQKKFDHVSLELAGGEVERRPHAREVIDIHIGAVSDELNDCLLYTF